MSEMKTSSTWTVIELQGDLVASQIDQLREHWLHAIEGGALSLAIDLTGVSMIDSKGLALLMMCHNTLQDKDGKLAVVTSDEEFVQLFRVMRMDQHLLIAGSVDALSSTSSDGDA
jgi:anti-anti-sigma factor